MRAAIESRDAFRSWMREVYDDFIVFLRQDLIGYTRRPEGWNEWIPRW